MYAHWSQQRLGRHMLCHILRSLRHTIPVNKAHVQLQVGLNMYRWQVGEDSIQWVILSIDVWVRVHC